MNLSEITKKRRDHIQSCIDNNDNSHRIIADLYSDPSHFIYEILQNADDVKATEVIFILKDDVLEIIHNGEKLFDINDVDAITTIGSGTKENDINTIGKFGAGFKSVFAVTASPKIHSGEYHFSISDFIVPLELDPIETAGNTIFFLPFNHAYKKPNEIYNRLSEKLASLNCECLLFLNNIKEIKWDTRTDKGHYLGDVHDNRAFIISEKNGEEKQQEYIIYSKNIVVNDNELDIAIAYLYSKDSKSKKKKIIPVNNSKLYVYFHTNEGHNCKFLLHAPYKTTPGREFVPFDDPENKVITQGLADLVANSIINIKEKGLLNIDFINLLPIDESIEHPIYEAVYNSVYKLFKNDEVIPSSNNGTYTTAGDAVLARGNMLVNLLDSGDLDYLFNRKKWVSPEVTYNKTPQLKEYFTEKLKVLEINPEKLCHKIDSEFIANKPDKWMIGFYGFLAKNRSLVKKDYSLSKPPLARKAIMRLSDNTHASPFDEHDTLCCKYTSKGFSNVNSLSLFITPAIVILFIKLIISTFSCSSASFHIDIIFKKSTRYSSLSISLFLLMYFGVINSFISSTIPGDEIPNSFKSANDSSFLVNISFIVLN